MQLTETEPALLLQELAWARRLALHLTRDESQADDLAQEAFVVAHVSPPRPDQPLRPWLGRVVKNLFLMQLRSSGRRMRREEVEAASQTETTADTAELLERLEAQRRLVGLVQTLEEPLRTTLLLHYYEGLTSADIARRLDIPAGTVRWRLKTGLDRLRDRLDDSYGKRALWMAALAPKFERPPMNPITPLLKTGLLLAFGATAVIAAVTLHHAATPTASSAIVAEKSIAAAATPRMPRTAVPTIAKTPKVVDDDDDSHGILITSVNGPVTLDDDKLATLTQCFAGPDTEGRIDFQIDVTGSDASRTITSATPLAGDREAAGLHHPALEACAVDALKGSHIEVAVAFPASQRVAVITGMVKHESEMPPDPVEIVSEAALAGLPALGPIGAPVTLVEYNDFQCPFCAQLARTVEDLTQRYPTQLRVVFRNSPLAFHANAAPAAKAAIAAHQQGRFWQMHDLLFAHQQELDRASLFEYARRIGLDMTRFEAALNSKDVADALQRDLDAHERTGERGTPVMTVNGKIIRGARPADEIAKYIDEELVH